MSLTATNWHDPGLVADELDFLCLLAQVTLSQGPAGHGQRSDIKVYFLGTFRIKPKVTFHSPENRSESLPRRNCLEYY